MSTAESHEEMSRHLINFVIWMIRNAIFRFRDLDQDDFESFVNDARYGPFALLGYGPRLNDYVANLLSRGGKLPQIKKPRIRLPVLDTHKLLSDAGIDPRKGARDAGVSYEIARLSAEYGLTVIPDQINRLSKGKPSPRRICAIPVYRTLEPWLTQWTMREDLPGDRIQFNPFQNLSCMRLAQQLGRKPERTKTAPIQQTMTLIDRSIRWVLDYAPPILNARDKYLEIIEANPKTWTQNLLKASVKDLVIPEGPGRPFPLKATARRRTIHKDLELGVAVNNCLPAACAIVICAFTGRRHEEVLTLRVAGPANDGCISEDENGFWIEAFIEKTCRDWVKTPCNELVAKAVSVLECWSAPARTASAKVGLFQLRRLTKEPIVTFRLAKSLKYFVSFLNLPALPDGSYWDFTPHQFRRFFAIMYFWRYHYRNLGALSHHLRHFDPGMTLTYLTERDPGVIFRKVAKEHTLTLLSETAAGERNLSGPFGERFKNAAISLYRRFHRKTRVVAPSLMRKVIERYVDKNHRRLKPMRWGYCACGDKPYDVKRARCLKDKSARNSKGPDLAIATPTICCDCPHHATEKVFEPFLRTEIEFHERAAECATNGPLLRSASREHLQKLKQHCQRSFEHSKPLELPNV